MRSMRLLLCSVIFLAFSIGLQAGEGRLLKVLPHYLDKKGRHTLHPSLYERDSYQAHLRQHPSLRSGIRFAVNWKAKKVDTSKLKIRVELRGVTEKAITSDILELPVKKGLWFNHWDALILTGDRYEKLGNVQAWRVTIWEGDQQIAEQKSFLW